MKIKILLIAAGFVCVGYLVNVFLHKETPVNFAQKVEYFKSHGVPDFELFPLRALPSQRPLQLSDFNSKVTLINFWATWCKPCIAEYPGLVALSRIYQNDPRLKIVAIAVHSTPKDVEDFVSRGASGASNLIILLDPDGKVAADFGTEKIPETYIINEKHLLLTKVIDQQNWVSPGFLNLLKGWL